MEINNSEKTMTVKEISEALDIPSRTIRRIAKSLFNESMCHGQTSRFNESQCFAIACKVGKVGQKSGQVGQVSPIDYELLSAAIAKAVVIAIREIIPAINQQKQIAAPTLSPRDGYRKAINSASQRTGISQQELYGMVATELYYRKHVNIKVKAKNSGNTMIDIIEQEGLLFDAIAIADEM